MNLQLKKEKILAIDIDNTVSDTIETWMAFAEQILRENGIEPARKPGIFSVNDAFGIERGSELHRIVKKRNQELNLTNWKDYKVVKNAKENLLNLKKEGFSLVFLSARADEYFGDAQKVTENWLQFVGIPFDKVICNCEEKGGMCKKIGASILIDDGLQYCKMAIENGISAIYFDDEDKLTKQSGQSTDHRITVCKNWNEIHDAVTELTKLSYKEKENEIFIHC